MKGEREPPRPQRTASNSQRRYLPKAKSNGKRPDSEFDRFERLTKRLIQVEKGNRREGEEEGLTVDDYEPCCPDCPQP